MGSLYSFPVLEPLLFVLILPSQAVIFSFLVSLPYSCFFLSDLDHFEVNQSSSSLTNVNSLNEISEEESFNGSNTHCYFPLGKLSER